jgi:hypothetical protein
MRFVATGFLVVALLWTPAASAATFRPGDIIVAGAVEGDGFFPTLTGKIREFAPDGTLVQEFYSGVAVPLDLKFSPSGILHAAGGGSIIRFASDGSLLAPLLGPSPGYFMHSLAFDRSGRLFATTVGGSVLRFGSDGSQQGVISLPGVLDTEWADLGRDQCTHYHIRSPLPQIGRFDVCTNTSLAPLPTTLDDFGLTLLVLSDGTLLVSGYDGLYRIKEDGTVLRHYGTLAIAYARDTSPNFVWVVTHNKVAKFDLQNDVFATVPFDAGVDNIFGIAVVGADVPTIPALSPLLFMFLGLVLASVAVLRLRM